MTAEERYALGLRPFCLTCGFCLCNTSRLYTKDMRYKNPITKRINKLHMKKNSYYCTHIRMCSERGKPTKINGNHLRWWGSTPSCPYNIYTHTCEACGRRMATSKTICSSCKRNRDLDMRGVL